MADQVPCAVARSPFRGARGPGLVTAEEALRTLSTLADRAKAEGWHTPLPPDELARARAALSALADVLPAPAREALLAEAGLRWAQVALAAAALEVRRRD